MADPNNIQADVPYRTAIADRGKFFPVDTDYLTSIGYPASGEGKYAILTYSINTGTSTPTSGGPGDELGPITNLDAVSATGPGAIIDVSIYRDITVHIIAENVSVGGTVEIQHSLDGAHWATVTTDAITTDEVIEVTMSNVAYKNLRTNLTIRSDGEYTTMVYAGN